MLIRGLGVAADAELGMRWISSAADRGLKEAIAVMASAAPDPAAGANAEPGRGS